MFSAHGIAVAIGAEHHASLLGPMGGSFLSLDISVDEEDREEAVALLRDFREGNGSKGTSEIGDDGVASAAEAGDEVAAERAGDAARSSEGDASLDDPGSSVELRIDRRRQTGAVLLLGCIVTFGTAHMFTRAWLRGIALAAIEVVGIMHLWAGHAIGGGVIAAAIVADLVGALRRVWTKPPPALPVARIRKTREARDTGSPGGGWSRPAR
jgi:hypothetical protein